MVQFIRVKTAICYTHAALILDDAISEMMQLKYMQMINVYQKLENQLLRFF